MGLSSYFQAKLKCESKQAEETKKPKKYFRLLDTFYRVNKTWASNQEA